MKKIHIKETSVKSAVSQRLTKFDEKCQRSMDRHSIAVQLECQYHNCHCSINNHIDLKQQNIFWWNVLLRPFHWFFSFAHVSVPLLSENKTKKIPFWISLCSIHCFIWTMEMTPDVMKYQIKFKLILTKHYRVCLSSEMNFLL